MARWLTVIVVLAACGGPLDHKRLHGAVDQLAAYGAEAQLLSRMIEHGETTHAYARVQRSFLIERIAKTRDDLGRGVDERTLVDASARAEQLAAQLEAVVRQGATASEIGSIADQLRGLEIVLAEDL